MLSIFQLSRVLLLVAFTCINSGVSYSLGSHQRKDDNSMPPPWTRELYLDTEYLKGSDVLIMCTLLHRDDAVLAQTGVDECDEVFDMQDETGSISYFFFISSNRIKMVIL